LSYNYLARKVNGKKIDEHRFVWEQTNGEIPKGYIIHHIDENKRNNKLENLQMMTSKEHNLLHGNTYNPKDMSPEKYTEWYQAVCKANAKHSIPVIDGKTLCRKCNEMLPINMFSKNSSKANGCESFCRQCRSKHRKQLSQLTKVS